MSDTVSTADLFDTHGDELCSLSLQLRNYGGVTGFTGQIRTIRCFEDNGLVKSVLATPGHGSVLVVDGGGSVQSALMGDQIAAMAVDNGWSGVIIHGAVRDRVALGTLPLGVKALGSNPARSAKNSVGEVDVLVNIGGVQFRPGAQVWCDADGVLVER